MHFLYLKQLLPTLFHGRRAGVSALLSILLSAAAINQVEAAPWRLSEAAQLPQWLRISGEHRTRYETLDKQYRRGRTGGDQMLALRTLLKTELIFDPLSVGIELIDSRAALDDAGSPLNTTMINPAELLQAYVEFRRRDWIVSGSKSALRAGRLAIDVGSRRFVARNRYRNTINSFTGVEWQWQGANKDHFQAFFTLPVNRKPNTFARLNNNDIEFDEEDLEVRFWGLFYASSKLISGHRTELFFFGLDESDSNGRPTRNRELYTPGLRFLRPKASGRIDYLLEAALQFGEVRSSTAASNTRDLDHFAQFVHAELGYTLTHAWQTRINLEFDFASGDDDPSDGSNQRFDTLFGARRFDFGPTGIYGPFARANLITPGIRLNFKPLPEVAVMLGYRGYWLDEQRDAWTTARISDASGNSGRFIAHQLEARFRFDVAPGNYRFEAGVAGLFDGEFMRTAPNSPQQGDAFYAYTQIILKF